MPRRRRQFWQHLLVRNALLGCLVVSGTLLAVHAAPATADVIVSGDANTLRLKVRRASVEEVLGALAKVVSLRFSVRPNPGRHIDGDFEGPLPHVLSRVLNGHDYMIRYSANGASAAILSAKFASDGAAMSRIPLIQMPQRTGWHSSASLISDRNRQQKASPQRNGP
jgi:hypothetical protein